MRVVVLAGGVGAARFLQGLVSIAPEHALAGNVTVVGNTADDISMFGLRVCPDLDSVMYTLGGGADLERGWGRANESYVVQEELRAYGATPDWFTLGDRDFATLILRSQMLSAGYRPTDVTRALAARWNLPVTLLPMTDDRVETHVVVAEQGTGEPVAIHFQEWWVRHRASQPAQQFVYVGRDDARPTAEVLTAIEEADVIILPPSNPIVSISPITGIPGIRDTLANAQAKVIGVSPIIGNAPVRGMADACLAAVGVDVSAAGVAGFYGPRSEGGLLDGWIIDNQDVDQQAAITELGITVRCCDTLFSHDGAAANVAALALEMGAAR